MHGSDAAMEPDAGMQGGYMGLPNRRVLVPRLRVAIALTIPVLVLAMGPMIGLPVNDFVSPRASGLLQLVLTTPVFFWSGWFFIRRFFISIETFDFNMFTLTVLGTGAAYGYSLAVLLAPQWFPIAAEHGGERGLYFEAAAVITTIVLLGQILEQRAHARTGDALRALLDLTPPLAARIVNGEEQEVPLGAVNVNDRLRVRPGERVPVDGVVVEGGSAIDESMLTGEPIPAEKEPGGEVRAGTLNRTGSFIMEARKVGSDTVLAHIVELVREAQEGEPPIARVADRVSAFFIPTVLGVAALTFVFWMWFGTSRDIAFALSNAVAVLVIACPCALGLATPVSIVTGIGRGAGAGVLVRDAGALERLRHVDTVLFDKTGTLTEGKPALARVETNGSIGEDEFLAIAAAIEEPSEHPLGSAVVVAARERGLKFPAVEGFAAIPGGGVRGRVAGRSVTIGTARLLLRESITISRTWSDGLAAAEKIGRTAVLASIDGEILGMLAFEDPIKEATPGAVAEMHTLGLKLVMVTGDSEVTARAVAARIGIDEVHAGVEPHEKRDLVQAIRAQGRSVAFAGDGINDAPALALADVGIAMGTGTDIAMESAGLILMKGDLPALVRAIHLSRAVLRNIKQNLFFAFVYNGLGIPIAAGLLYPVWGWLLSPMIAGVAMSLSSLSVVSNALRLRRVKI